MPKRDTLDGWGSRFEREHPPWTKQSSRSDFENKPTSGKFGCVAIHQSVCLPFKPIDPGSYQGRGGVPCSNYGRIYNWAMEYGPSTGWGIHALRKWVSDDRGYTWISFKTQRNNFFRWLCEERKRQNREPCKQCLIHRTSGNSDKCNDCGARILIKSINPKDNHWENANKYIEKKKQPACECGDCIRCYEQEVLREEGEEHNEEA